MQQSPLFFLAVYYRAKPRIIAELGWASGAALSFSTCSVPGEAAPNGGHALGLWVSGGIFGGRGEGNNGKVFEPQRG